MNTALFVIAVCMMPVWALFLMARRAYVRRLKTKARLDGIWFCPRCSERMESKGRHVCGNEAA